MKLEYLGEGYLRLTCETPEERAAFEKAFNGGREMEYQHDVWGRVCVGPEGEYVMEIED